MIHGRIQANLWVLGGLQAAGGGVRPLARAGRAQAAVTAQGYRFFRVQASSRPSSSYDW